MRLTSKLCAQHLGWQFKKNWQVQGKRVPIDTGAYAELQKLGVEVKNAQDVISPKLERKSIEVVGYTSLDAAEDETHPNWHQKPCYIYGNQNVLLEGVPQAQLLTKTIEIAGMPKSIEQAISRMQLPSTVDRSVQTSIMASHVFDAEQVKLPKRKLPDRPAINLPRDYGISHERRMRLLINKLIAECEKLAGHSVSVRRRLIDQADFSITLPKDDDLLQFAISADKMITAARPLQPIQGKFEGELPDLFPIKCTITIPKRHIYTADTFFPFSNNLSCSHPHTIFLHYNKELVSNLHESSVSTTQFHGRTLLKAFAVAAARAKQLYGDNALQQQLPTPIVVQSIQTDGRTFHFGVFQLNTLALGGTDGLKNYWFHQPNLDLFAECGYEAGRPVLKGYNKDVFRCVSAFYNNS